MIPKKFKLGAVEWKVSIEDIELSNEESLGMSYLPDTEIKIAKNYKGKTLNPQLVEQTLYHEVVHAILSTMCKNDLNKDEEFVQGFSLLLHQFEKTKE